jgi:hypothetical protein
LAAIPYEVIGLWILFVWFGIETFWDLRRSVILPLWLVLPPVVLGVVAQLLYGSWLVAAAMTAAVLLHLSGKLPIRLIGTILLVAAAATVGNLILAAGFFLYWILWETNIMGGADALAAYAALLVAPHMGMFWSLLAGMFVWAAVGMVIVYRTQLISRVRSMLWRISLRDLPKESELDAEGKPTIGGMWLGLAFYMVWIWLWPK